MSNSLIHPSHGDLLALRTDVTYSMTFINNSHNAWDFCCYQRDPTIEAQGALPAAWFVKQVVHRTTTVSFKWGIEYGLSWSQSGIIAPGIIYSASQDWSVSPKENLVTLAKDAGSYTFGNQRFAEPEGVFQIDQNGTVVEQDLVSIGISMRVGEVGSTGGLSTVYAQNAQPNITTQFRVSPSYWVAFQQNIQPSQILNVANFTKTAQVKYAPGVYAMVAELDETNNWHVHSLADVNTRYLQGLSSISSARVRSALQAHA